MVHPPYEPLFLVASTGPAYKEGARSLQNIRWTQEASVQQAVGNYRLDARREIWVEIRDLGSLEFRSDWWPRSPNKNVYSEKREGGQEKTLTGILLTLSRGKEASKGQRKRRTAELGIISREPREERREPREGPAVWASRKSWTLSARAVLWNGWDRQTASPVGCKASRQTCFLLSRSF